MKSKVIIVNQNDEIIWYKNRWDINSHDIYRVAALWVENNKWEVLLAQRSFNKKNNPGQWSCAACGTVDEWETYDDNIYKEAEEEIWLMWENFKKCRKEFRAENNWEFNFFLQWYYLKIDKSLEDFMIQEEEIEQIKWYKKEELLWEITKNPKNFSDWILKYIKYFEEK